MQYKHAKQNQNHEDYSSGRVLSGYSGATNFPVRLTQEIFETCADYLQKQNNNGPWIMYDPFCGVAYTLTVIGMLYGDKVQSVFASDINDESLEFAKKNLSLLTEAGMNTRMEEIQLLISQYGKDSHKEALKSALHIKSQLQTTPPTIKVFKNDILKSAPDIKQKIDILIGDIPYGNLTEWDKELDIQDPTQKFLNNIKDILSPVSIVAVSSNKKQEVVYSGYTKVGTFKTGKRKVLFLAPNN